MFCSRFCDHRALLTAAQSPALVRYGRFQPLNSARCANVGPCSARFTLRCLDQSYVMTFGEANIHILRRVGLRSHVSWRDSPSQVNFLPPQSPTVVAQMAINNPLIWTLRDSMSLHFLTINLYSACAFCKKLEIAFLSCNCAHHPDILTRFYQHSRRS